MYVLNVICNVLEIIYRAVVLLITEPILDIPIKVGPSRVLQCVWLRFYGRRY